MLMMMMRAARDREDTKAEQEQEIEPAPPKPQEVRRDAFMPAVVSILVLVALLFVIGLIQ